MSDPHVVALRYRFISVNEYDRFGQAAPLSVSASGFDVHLEDGLLTAKPHDHFATEEDARRALEPFLRDLEARARLERARREIRFDFEDAEIVERSPGDTVIRLPVIRSQSVVMDAVISVDNRTYPSLPDDLQTDPVLEAILRRLKELDARRTTVTDAANWVLTKIEEEFGAGARGSDLRKATARALALDDAILSNLGRLASQNDPSIGRKAKGPEKPLTAGEQEWMRAAIVLIAQQIGVRNAATSLAHRSMSDLPTLS